MSEYFDVEAEDLTDEPLDESLQPTIDADARDVAALPERFYNKSLRGPGDVVLSGPIIGGWGPGRYFRNKALAKRYLILKYGEARVRPVGWWTRGRWAYLIKNLKKEGGDVAA